MINISNGSRYMPEELRRLRLESASLVHLMLNSVGRSISIREKKRIARRKKEIVTRLETFVVQAAERERVSHLKLHKSKTDPADRLRWRGPRGAY